MAALGAALIFSGCSSRTSGILPHVGGSAGQGIFDRAQTSCAVSEDGLLWYLVPAGSFSPIDVNREQCAPDALAADSAPPIPAWAKPDGPTQTRFVAVSLQETYSLEGMELMESTAAAHHVPMSWMIGNSAYLLDANTYTGYHASNGDDVEAEHSASLIAAMRSAFPWYVPTVSVEGAGHERDPLGAAQQFGEYGFWGITWDSRGIDGTVDLGAPWGAYCADPQSYKRPDPDGTCPIVAFEWTARDLTRAYLSGHDEYFSTDPDDLLERAAFGVPGAVGYVRALADAYAAAGETQPIVMVSQQESAEDLAPGDSTILDALYGQAVGDGMTVETLAKAAADARTFAAAPRAVAFPYIAGGVSVPSRELGGDTLYPATIDYHDALVGMTFLAGHTMPERVFRYADETTSIYDRALPQLPPSQMPTLTSVTVSNGTIAFALTAPVALHFGVALWSNPAALGVSGPNVVPAGRAGAVLVFDLQPGSNEVLFHCSACTGTTLPYAT
jgi:hypothetical protein